MKTLTIWEPFATAIILGLKQFETRSWDTQYTGPLLIHAAKKKSKSLRDFTRKIANRYQIEELEDYDALPFGKVVGKVELIECVPTEKIFLGLWDNYGLEEELGDFAPNRYGWKMEDPKQFDPYPITGYQGLFEAPCYE